MVDTMGTDTGLDVAELYQTYTSEEQIKESFERFTVPTGRYTFTPKRVQTQRASDRSPWPGREMVRLFGQLFDREDGSRKGSVGFDGSWDVRRMKNNKLDGPSKLWGQLVTALDMKAETVGKVVEAAGGYQLSLYVTEAFKTPDGWRTARTPEQRRDYRKAGYDAKNFVDSVSRV